MNEAPSPLAREAVYLHAVFFRRQIPEAVIARYVAANRLCFPELEVADREMMQTIVDRGLDAEAIELAMRLARRSSVLTRKIQILFYLVEVRSAYYGDFVNQRPGLGRALAPLLRASLQAVWKGAKGRYLVWQYGFARPRT